MRRPRSTSKFGNIKTVADGITFDSSQEATHYQQLLYRQKAGEIVALCADKRFLKLALVVNGVNCGYYEADFTWVDVQTGVQVWADSKGVRTPIFILKKKLVLALHGIEILELKAGGWRDVKPQTRKTKKEAT